MGKIKIVKKEEPKICEVDFLREQYETDGQYQVKMLMFGDNYTVAEDSYRTYLTPEAVKKIFDYINWGKIDHKNTAEQGGFLIGRYIYDPEKELNIAIVETAIPARHARGSAGTLEIQNQDMLEMHQQLDMINGTRSEEDKLLVLGWFHTHPNTLDVFMSGTDRYTQRTFFSGDRALAIVLNPHRKIWKCFRAAGCHDTMAEMLLDEDLLNEYGKKRLLNESFRFGG